jgi:hypothetical protein
MKSRLSLAFVILLTQSAASATIFPRHESIG